MFVNIALIRDMWLHKLLYRARELLSRIKRLEVGEFQTAHTHIIYRERPGQVIIESGSESLKITSRTTPVCF
jgi:hypothetical protein